MGRITSGATPVCSCRPMVPLTGPPPRESPVTRTMESEICLGTAVPVNAMGRPYYRHRGSSSLVHIEDVFAAPVRGHRTASIIDRDPLDRDQVSLAVDLDQHMIP